jgi:predicted branched-subunit amino acid permease
VSAEAQQPAPAAARRDAFRQGRRAILPYLPGAFAWGMISGVAMVKGGLPVPWAIAMSLLVYAGSAQLAALPLIVAGAPLWVIVATGFITNLRFVIYSAAMRPYFADRTLGRRIVLGYFMTDFTFVRFMRSAQEADGKDRMPTQHRDAWFAGVCSSNWLTWQVSAISGIIGASYVPTEWGLEFTGTLALVALVGPSLNVRPAVVGAVVAALIALFAHALPFKLGLFCGAIAGIVAATLTEALQKRDPPADVEAA